MFKEKRWQMIQEMINNNGKVEVAELASSFNVSTMTIRRDLKSMVKKGLIERTHGGAILTKERNPLKNPLMIRLYEESEEKRAIARVVSKMIKSGEKIYIAAGTTTYWVAKAITERSDLTVVTNSLPVANLLSNSDGIELIVVGGFLRRNEFSMVGHFAESQVRDLHMNKVIMGISGIHPEHGLTSNYLQSMMMDRAYMNISENIIVVADHTKFGYVAASRIADIKAARTIVTTRKAPMDVIERIREQGIEVIFA
jgi:DeoR family transcriptional regulator, aga operon transcriptional repressor